MTIRASINVFILLSAPVCVLAGESAKPGLCIDDPPQGRFTDDWMEIYIGDAKAGYANASISREGDEILHRMVMHFSLGRGGVEVKCGTSESSRETLGGLPLSFESHMNMSAVQTSTRGEVRDGKVTIKSKGLGPERTETYDYPKGALMGWGLYRMQHQLKLTEGATIEVSAYVPQFRLDDAVKVTFQVGPRETIEVRGKKIDAIRVDQVMASPIGTLKLASWVDDELNALVVEYPIPALGALRMVTTDQATATRGFAAPEFFTPTIVRADRPIDRKAAKRITYRLSVVGKGDDLPALPTTGMQKPGKGDARRVELTVARQDHAGLKEHDAPAAAGPYDDSVKPFLAPSLYINSDDPNVIAMARQAAGDEKNAYALADELRRFVTDEIKEKGMDVGFASASEVCRDRKGDCSEHGVLLAALGRVHGIPSRVVSGLVYVPTFSGNDDVFGFHMWTQFYVAGQWLDVDAAQRETDCNPTHIALTVLSNNDTSMAEAAFAMLPVLGRLKIEVLSIE